MHTPRASRVSPSSEDAMRAGTVRNVDAVPRVGRAGIIRALAASAHPRRVVEAAAGSARAQARRARGPRVCRVAKLAKGPLLHAHDGDIGAVERVGDEALRVHRNHAARRLFAERRRVGKRAGRADLPPVGVGRAGPLGRLAARIARHGAEVEVDEVFASNLDSLVSAVERTAADV